MERYNSRSSFNWYMYNLVSTREFNEIIERCGMNYLLNVVYFFVHRVITILNDRRGRRLNFTDVHAMTILIVNDCIAGNFDSLFDILF